MTEYASHAGGPILHIGYPKCGSTYLPTRVLPHLKDTPCLETGEEETLFTSTGYRALPRDLPFIARGCSRYYYSNESMLTWRHAETDTGHQTSSDRCLDSLIRIFADYGHFIIQIRRQDSLALSVFQYSSPSFLTSPERIFIDFPGRNLGSGVIRLNSAVGQVYVESFDFWRVISRLMTFVGRERITILPLKELEQDPHRYFQRLSSVFQEDLSWLCETHAEKVNVSEKTRTRYPEIFRRLAPLIRNTGMGNLARGLLNRKAGISETFAHRLLAHFEPGNRRVSETFDLDLQRYGYFD